ncbi:hypothetical protein MKW98_019838 [Papaver atlanticum]|uniref:phosphopyruvate hydratase n=1 Tax=Papaver atlanticum TaxID=357466 RepID=A0AAD4S0Q5_9MAGN|nr:hypothetical protein MKW98_019838 [Papaver atlanticum]
MFMPTSTDSALVKFLLLPFLSNPFHSTSLAERAVTNINEMVTEANPTLSSQIDQAMIDLDKTENEGELGANAILAVLIGFSVPSFTKKILVGEKSIEELVQTSSNTYHHLEAIITEKHGRNGCNVDEAGGFASNMPSFTEVLNLVKEPIDRGDYNDRIKIAMDVAATDFCVGCWSLGDDLLMSNPKRTEKAIDEISCNMLVLKVNQIGTVTEIIEAVKLAKNAN